MSSPTTSLVSILKHDALRAGERLLADVATTRAASRERAIQSYMASWMWVWTRRFPFVRHFNHAEAEKAVDWSHWSNHASYWRYDRYEEERLAQTLISAAHVAQDEYVLLNLDEAHVLRKWL